jgi:hypothetical protein
LQHGASYWVKIKVELGRNEVATERHYFFVFSALEDLFSITSSQKSCRKPTTTRLCQAFHSQAQIRVSPTNKVNTCEHWHKMQQECGVGRCQAMGQNFFFSASIISESRNTIIGTLFQTEKTPAELFSKTKILCFFPKTKKLFFFFPASVEGSRNTEGKNRVVRARRSE